jgi:hypothetical protein
VIDGVYPDVRSILVYQAGALRLEEYFYGYDRNQPHQMRSFTKSVIALLAGAAVDRGKLRADEPVLGRLGYAAYANPDPPRTGSRSSICSRTVRGWPVTTMTPHRRAMRKSSTKQTIG